MKEFKMKKQGKKWMIALLLMAMFCAIAIPANAENVANVQPNEPIVSETELYSKSFFDDSIRIQSSDLLSAEYQTFSTRASGTYRDVTLRTTGNLSVDARIYSVELTEEDYAEIDDEIARLYPNVIELDRPTYNYNCHSYAWYERSTDNTYWIGSPQKFIDDDHSIEITNVSDVQVGDIVVYYTYGEPSHSAVVTAIGDDGIICDSKWGAGGLYRHEIDDVHYLYSIDEQQGSSFLYSFYRYVQGEHTLSVISTSTENHTLDCRYCSYQVTNSHIYRYVNTNAYYHTCVCKVCSYSKTQAHVAHIVTGKCTYCLRPGPFLTPLSLRQAILEDTPVAIYDNVS